jgi:aspartate carbamoyltransferase catalytic subunit
VTSGNNMSVVQIKKFTDSPVIPAIRSDLKPRHVLSTKDIDREYMENVFELALGHENRTRFSLALRGASIALLFFQPSTRTRLGFEVATVALGAHAVGMDDMSASRSNARTGESLEDAAAVISNLTDAIVVRHHEVGAAARMAARARCPVINAGDGFNEHPTQALIDLYTLRRALGDLKGRAIAFCGDPRGRTVRSLVQLLRFEDLAELVFCAPPHIPVPEDLTWSAEHAGLRLRLVNDVADELRCRHDGSLRHVRHRGSRRVGIRVTACDPANPRGDAGEDRDTRFQDVPSSPSATSG